MQSFLCFSAVNKPRFRDFKLTLIWAVMSNNTCLYTISFLIYCIFWVFLPFFYIPFLIRKTFLSYIEDSIFQMTFRSSWYENVIISLSICWVPETMISGYGYGVAVSTGVYIYICFNLFCFSQMVSICCKNKPIRWGNRATFYGVIISINNAENS